MFQAFATQRKFWGLRVKNTIEYADRNEQKREEFASEIEALPEDSDLYYVDESGFDEYYSREYGYFSILGEALCHAFNSLRL